ncbi:non-ribosomal peptide synthetase [Streptomyces hesseae]|uniref:Amino acid adenylation domain-containing protein n=1 Tax=Streptomyces hesseae TaxID=3075519 RepID=A0ABU2SI66_9ACTN|nr:non-ribosomal peptide synthetase [Streptomyces sp. DSM 40473]MDT0448084.1 amino acid adenylation domain-containing protein [Streptomyces sp. DSM 40473]
MTDTPGLPATVCELPLSVGQEAMWISWRLDPQQWTHIIPTPYRVTGVLDTRRLRRAVAALGEAYPQLRARVVEGPGGPRLSWADAPPIPVTEHTVEGDPVSAVRRTWQRPFDLTTGPLARVDVLHGDEGSVLLIAAHHLVHDGASILLLLDALRRAYAGQSLAPADHIGPLTAFARRSRELADTPAGDDRRAYWRSALGDGTGFELPATVDEPGYTVLSTEVPAPLVPRLRARAEELGVSYFTVLLGAYFALLRRFAGEDDLLASIPYHGRSAVELRDKVGYFVNALPIRRRVGGTESYADLIRALRGDVKAAMANGDLPLPSILREVGLTGWQAHARSHQTVFQYWHAGLRQDVDVQRFELRPDGALDGAGCVLSLLDMESSADYTLAVMVREDSGGTHVLWKDPAGACGPTMVAMMAAHYTEVLTAVAADPQAPVGALGERVDTVAGPVNTREVAALLHDHPAVRHAVVTPTGGDAELAARLTLDPAGADVPVERLTALLRERLGDRAPRVRFDFGTAGSGDTVASEQVSSADSATTAVLIELWQDVLGIDGITPEDSFFELGGHSLLAAELADAITRRLGLDVSVRAVFEHPRLGELAVRLDALRAPEPVEEAVAEEPPSFPASGFQERIWLAERLEAGSAAYNVPLAWRIPGGLEHGALARALALLVSRHEILRTSFVEHDGRLRQVVDEPWSPEPEFLDLRGRDDSEEILRERLNRLAHHAFDPASGRLLTAALVQLGEDDQVLFVCLHHLVWDGGSAGVFLRELADCYAAAETGPATEAGLPAEAMEAAEAAGAVPAAGALHPASAHQGRMGFIDHFERGVVYDESPVYHNLPLYVRLDRAPEPEALRAAVARAELAHEALRTNLVLVDDRIAQCVTADARIAPQWFEPVADHTDVVPDALRVWAAEPFDLAAGPLLRVAVQPGADGGAWLALAGHQAVVDRVSLTVLAEQILAAPDAAPTAGPGYRDWLEALPQDRKELDLAARAEELRGEIDPLRLPERHPREAVHVYREQSVPLRLPATLPLERFARERGLSEEQVLLAAFATLLSWYSGQDEMVLGVADANRRDGSGTVVGPLANLLPLRLRTPVSASFEDLAAATGTALDRARSHPLAPFDELVALLDPGKDMSRTALFDVFFCYAAGPGSLTLPDGGEARLVEEGSGYGKYDLTLFLRPDGAVPAGRLVFNGLYFDEPQIQLMAEHYARLLEQLLAEPGRPVGEADPLTEQEAHTQLAVWNATEAHYPQTTLHALVREQAGRRPHTVALSCGQDRRGYGELQARAELLARGLVARGVRPGELVALLLPRGVAQVEAMLAVLLAGAAYLPIDPAVPAERQSFILTDSGARFAVAGDDAAGRLGFMGTVVTSEELAATPGADVAVLPDTGPDSPAYCIYTSGTTGRPKGVVVSHRNAVRLIVNDRFPFSFGPADVWTMFHSYAFDFSVWELFCGLAHGGRVVIVPEEEARDARQFWQLIQHERVTVLNQTPSAFRQLLAVEEESPAPLDHLRYVIFGGEQLQPAMLGGWLERRPQVRLVNMYGITETTVHVTVRTVTRADADADRSVIGTPIPTTTVHLADPRTGGRLLPVGAVGEILVGGEGVTAGYLGRPELTAERFVTAPFGGGTLFRSGDLARYRTDGSLEYLGRGDSQVQLRGYRIELGEIQSCLREHPAVADATVLVEDDRLVAYLQTAGEPPTGAQLRRHLGAKLPEYMIPARFRTVPEIRLTVNGKLDTTALRAVGVPLENAGTSEPRTPTARTLAALWAELLDVPSVGADDSFFALGGHSLLAVRMLGRVTRDFGPALPLRTLFESPRLQDFADLVDTHAGTVAAPAGKDEPSGQLLPASGFQERIWLAERAAPDDARYNVVLAWRAEAGLDAGPLRGALDDLIRRQEILRTRFVEHGDRLHQLVGEAWSPEIELLDLRSSFAPDDGLRDWLDRAARRPFDPASGRLLRVALADTGGTDRVLLLCLHHLVVDGESVPVLLRELERSWNAVAQGRTAEPPTVQYRDFVADQEAGRDGAKRATDLAHAAERLAGAPAYARLPEPAVPGPNGAVAIPLPADTMERLRRLQSEQGVSWFMAAAAALAVLLHRWTGRQDVTFGVPVSTRDRGRFAELLGPCLDLTVLRSRPDADATLRDAVRAMRSEVLEAFEHRGAPFDELVEALRPERRPGRTPYADVALNMNLLSGRRTVLGGGELRPLFFDSFWEQETKFALTVTLSEQDGALSGAFSYRGDRFAAEDVRLLAEAFGRLLAGLPELLDLPLDGLGLPTTGPGLPAAADGEPLRPLPVAASGVTAPRGRVQYRDYVAAQEARRDGAKRAADLAHWTEHLAGAPPYLDFPAPRTSGPNGAVPIPLADGLLERWRPLQREHGFTPYLTAAAALATLLHRWTGTDDVVFAGPLAHRDEPEFADLLGPCLDTVVLRSRPADGATVLDLLHAMRSELLGAVEHRDAPFEEIVDRLNPPRRPGRTPYADVQLSLETASDRPPTLAGRPLTPFAFDRQGAGFIGKLGLTVVLTVDGGNLSGVLTYRGDRYRPADVTQFAALLGRIMNTLPDRLHMPIGELDLVGTDLVPLRAAERGPSAPPVTTVPELVAHWCALQPGAPAVETAGGTLDYRRLAERADALADRIRPHLRATDPMVALVLGRGAALPVAMLAAWQAGAAFCPIEPGHPADRIDFILDDLDAGVVLTDDPAVLERLAATGRPVLDVTDTTGATATASPVTLRAPDPESAAYVIYTSGTTGRPKGVTVRHGALGRLVLWGQESFGLGPHDRVAQVLSPGFDASQWDIWSALGSGGCLVPLEGTMIAPELAGWLDARRISTCLVMTPLAEAMWNTDAPAPRHLRHLLVGGAAFTQWPPTGLPYRVRNVYGPTETTVFALHHELTDGEEGPLNRLGRPLTGVEALILDSRGRRCPVGVVGEICLGGALVAAGYWRRPELTAERFRPTGPDGEPGVVYRTGDLGRRLADGTVEFLGRADRQVKVRGYRIEPGEIEAVLLAEPEVALARVQADPKRSPALTAYLVPSAEKRPEATELLRRLRGTLPAFMVPEAVVWLDALPLTPNGKVDEAALPRPGREDLATRSDWVAPGTGLARRIAAVWSEVLGLAEVGAHDNFYDLGGNSLLLAKLHSRLTAVLERDLPISQLFEHPTVATLADALGDHPQPAGRVGADGSRTRIDLRDRAARSRSAAAARQARRRR